MTFLSHVSTHKSLFVLALGLTLAAPSWADGWRGGPGMSADHPNCQYHRDLRDANACPYTKMQMQMQNTKMQTQMPRRAMQQSARQASGKMLSVIVSELSNAVLDATGLNYGVSVERVQADSIAAQAGIRAGDLITDFGGIPVFSTDRLRWLVQKIEAGKPMEIGLLRDGQAIQLDVNLTPPAAEPSLEPEPAPAPEPVPAIASDENPAPKVAE